MGDSIGQVSIESLMIAAGYTSTRGTRSGVLDSLQATVFPQKRRDALVDGVADRKGSQGSLGFDIGSRDHQNIGIAEFIIPVQPCGRAEDPRQ